MVRLLGLGGGDGSNKKRKKKKRLVGAAVPGVDGSMAAIGGGGGRKQQLRQRHNPGYQYALNEYSQTVPAGTSNDAGRYVVVQPQQQGSSGDDNDSGWYTANYDPYDVADNEGTEQQYHSMPAPPSTVGQSRSSHSSAAPTAAAAGAVNNDGESYQPPPAAAATSGADHDYGNLRTAGTSESMANSSTASTATSPMPNHQHHQYFRGGPHSTSEPALSSTNKSSSASRNAFALLNPHRSPFEEEIMNPYAGGGGGTGDGAGGGEGRGVRNTADGVITTTAYYEEYYGDAYTGGPIKYVYPSGYQSMRPRSGPWKLSIVVCALFTWLSVFVVGHCSDQVDQSSSYIQNDEIDDDTLVIDIRWCGSRPLYLMWVMSMLITGLAAAYCSVIGYIKVRDFAVGNCRSQPPGIVNGKSDYYVRIDDSMAKRYQGGPYPPAPPGSDAGASSAASGAKQYRTTIYQSDGTPQFWGAHIYHPTQAAVAITSR